MSKYEFLKYDLFNNSIEKYITALIAFFVFIIIFKIFQGIALHRLEKLAQKTKTDIDDTFITIVKSIKPPFYSFLAFYLALKFLFINDLLQKIIEIILIIWIIYQAIKVIQILIDYIIKKINKDKGNSQQSAINIIRLLSKSVIWILGLLLILSNLGVNITSLIAGLGIGGIAIALAIQNILSDLFSSFAIYFDKPFVVGDFIIIGDKMGVVEKIGIKTTRIRALQGEELVISNKELTSAQIQNFKKMQERRIVFSFGVIYETPTEKLKKIPKIVKEIIGHIKLARFDRAHFKKFDNSALSFEVVYYVTSSDYNQYMDIQQEINLKIKEEFKKESISMAYPTQMIYINKNNS